MFYSFCRQIIQQTNQMGASYKFCGFFKIKFESKIIHIPTTVVQEEYLNLSNYKMSLISKFEWLWKTFSLNVYRVNCIKAVLKGFVKIIVEKRRMCT